MERNYYVKADPGGALLALFRMDIDNDAETLDEYKWADGQWAETNDLSDALFDGDPDTFPVDADTVAKIAPDAVSTDEPAEKATEPTLVSKAIDERMFTLGPMYIPNRRDAHAEWTDPDELQKAVWDYVKKGDRRIRLQHNRDVVAGEWVEIMAWPYEVEAPILMKDATQTSMTFPANTVFLGVKWEPWAWDMIKAGKLRGYSIGGRAERLLADLPEGDVEKASVPLEAPAPAPTAMEIGEQIAAAVSEAMKAITPVVNVVMPDDKPKVRRVERDEHGNILRLIEE